MPKLPSSDPVLAQLPAQLPSDFAYPDVNELVQDASGDPASITRIQGWVAERAAGIYQAGGELGLASIVTKIGVAAEQTVESVANAIDESDTDWASGVVDSVTDTLGAAGAFVSALASVSDADGERLVKEAMQIGIGVSIQLMSQIPVVGWIAKIAWTLGNGIYQLVQVVKKSNEEDEPPAYPAVNFSPENDLIRFNNEVLGRLRTQHDWTKMFRPPGGGVPAQAAWLGEFETANLGQGNKVYGRTIKPTNPCALCLGFVPGTGFLHNNIEVVSLNVKDTGNTYLPSSRQHGLWIWEHIARHNSPALYTVDAKALEVGWRNYLKALRLYVEADDELSPSQKNKIVNVYNKDLEGNKIFGWGKPRTTEAGAWIPDEEANAYQPVAAARTVRERQLAFLDTMTCAYVDDSFGALSDPDVKAKWKQRRKDLLQHPAICNVDLSMIPDAIYRGQVEYAQDNRPSCKFGGPLNLAGGGAPKPPDVQGGGGGVAEPDGHGPSVPTTRIMRNVAIASGAIAAAGAAAYYFDDEIRRTTTRFRRR